MLFLLIATPLVGAVALIFTPHQRLGLTRWVAVATSSACLLLSALVFVSYDHGSGGFQFLQSWEWLEIPGPWGDGGLSDSEAPTVALEGSETPGSGGGGDALPDRRGIALTLGVDGISALMVLLTGVVMFTGTLVSWNINDRPKDFFILYFLLLSGVFGVFVSLDLFFLFFFYELAVLPMYPLIGVWGSSSTFREFIRTKEYGAMKLMLYLVAGSVLIWVALLAIFVEANIGMFDLQALSEVEFSVGFQRFAFPLLMVGFGVLAGMWPFHTWSPDGHVAAPSAVSMAHAGVLMKLGAYGIIRVGLTLLPEGAAAWMPVLVALGAVNVIYGAVAALGQRDLKYVIGYSSVSHMGYALMGMGTLHHLGMSGSVMQMFSHGVMTALFFAVVGGIYDRTRTRDIGALEGLAKRMGAAAWLFAIAGLASLGLPGLSGFVAELLVFIGLFQTYPLVGVVAVVGVGITAVYVLRLIGKVFFGELPERWRGQSDLSKREVAAAGILAGFIVAVGVFPYPFLRVIDGSVAELLARAAGAG